MPIRKSTLNKYPEITLGTVWPDQNGCWMRRCHSCQRIVIYSAKNGNNCMLNCILAARKKSFCYGCAAKVRVPRYKKPAFPTLLGQPLQVGAESIVLMPPDKEPIRFVVREVKCTRCGFTKIRKVLDSWAVCSCYQCWENIPLNCN